MLIVLLLLAAVFVGVGFAVHILWWGAILFFAAWLAGYAFARGQRRAGRRKPD